MQSPRICPNESGMPRCGQISRMAATSPVEVLHTRIGSPSITMPLRLPGRRFALEQAGYQNPSSGAFLGGLMSVIRSEFICKAGLAVSFGSDYICRMEQG